MDNPFTDSDTVRRRKVNNSDSDTVKYSNNKDKSKKVDVIAEQLVQIFNNPRRYKYYCKVAWKLPESIIWNNVESTKAKGVTDPARLFTFLCERNLN